MKVALFYHSFLSCWNNGNAHFLRGVARELSRMGHEVIVYEPEDGWSRINAVADGGSNVMSEASRLIPEVEVRTYAQSPDLREALDGVDLVLAHEWNPPELIAALGRMRSQGGAFTLLFHDTHHRAVTAPHELKQFDLDGFDGVLAFGEILRDIYLRNGWTRRAFTWHEAADTELYRPMPEIEKESDVVWIGNWGDDERSNELREFLMEPIKQLGLDAQIFGVRYPSGAIEAIETAGIHYGGWLPNHRAPRVFAAARATVHVPRRPYARSLPGIPTIRMFEAMACGIPLVSAPWNDCESLFPEDTYLRVNDGDEMKAALSLVLNDRDLAATLVQNALRVIRERHTCRHRVIELLDIVAGLRRPGFSSEAKSRQSQAAL